MTKYRWGIVGTGGIAAAMVNTLREMADTKVVAVASPTPGRAGSFAASHDIPSSVTSVEALGTLDIDVAYIGSSNHRHFGDATTLLEAGIAVLCEKSLATTAFEADRMVATARQQGVFLMEAMWMRFVPMWDRLADLIGNGAIGPLRLVRADFGIRAEDDPTRRWFNPGHGGGALLDVGIYPVSFAVGLAGVPISIEAVGTMTNTGVDGQLGMVFRHDHDVISVLDCSFVADTPIGAVVSGPRGRIVLDPPFHHSPRLALWKARNQTEVFDVGYTGSGYRFEVEEVHRCLAAGLTESTVRPLDDTRDVMRVLDSVRFAAFG